LAVHLALQNSWARACVAHQLAQNATHFAVGAAAAGVESGGLVDRTSVSSAVSQKASFISDSPQHDPAGLQHKSRRGGSAKKGFCRSGFEEAIFFDADHIPGQRPAVALVKRT
jgi:hypothetical protein